jgi:hypothetical protein
MIGLFPLSAADVAMTNDEWYTPRSLFRDLGLEFDLDVCAPIAPELRTCPAAEFLTVLEDGLMAPWHGLVWMNPPYSSTAPWVLRWARWPRGMALLPLTNARWLRELLPDVDALAILDVEFTRPDGVTGHMRYPSLLAARGTRAVEAISRVGVRFKSDYAE